jgi:hypothetical protein
MLLRVLVLLSSARDVGLRFDFALVIGDLLRLCGDHRRHHRSPTSAKKPSGRIPKRRRRPELDTVPLCLREEASPFWIILLLVWGAPAYSRIKLATPRLPKKALTNVRFRG